MNGYRFYEEFETAKDKRKSISSGNVLAVIPENKWHDGTDVCIEAIGAVHFHPDSEVCGTAVHREILSSRFRRISESKAREIHPKLFRELDREGFAS